jgi:hypothetical protein
MESVASKEALGHKPKESLATFRRLSARSERSFPKDFQDKSDGLFVLPSKEPVPE